MTLCTIPTVGVRPQVRERRPGRPPGGKRLQMAREMPGKVRSAFRRSLDPCDNSNDSGLGFDHHGDPHHIMSERLTWNGERAEPKRPKMDIKLENDDVNDRYCFPETVRTCKENTSLIRTAPAGSIPSLTMNNNQSSSSGRAVPRCIPLSNRQPSSSPIPLTTQLTSSSKYAGDVSLTIVKQPEQQHRARYQTEGSRGAVKDREGNGFPIVQLVGYYQPTTLQVFIGTDVGKVSPHMFYQACKVSGKNSTPCIEKKIEGTCVIELQLDPSKEMSATCDCVGILKERNVDVEHRFPDQLGNRSKKKSTRCRMIFRTTLTHDDGTIETLQVCSQPIVCTQPPGIPEICKKSLTACPATGGMELFVLGKNFLKDTKVYFEQIDDDRHTRWEQAVVPDKEYLQQTHFVCVVPPYRRPDISEPVTVRVCVVSSGKTSESHQFVYTPVNGAIPSVHVDSPPAAPQAQFFNKLMWSQSVSKREQDLGMMPPPESSIIPMAPRRPSISIPSGDNMSPPLHSLKQEYIDDNSQNSLDQMDHQERYRHISESSLDAHHGDSNMSMINENSVDMMHHNAMMGDNSSENSVEMMVRRNSMSRNSMDVNMSINEESSCSPVMHCSSNAGMTERGVLTQPALMQTLLSNANNTVTAEELKVMDLRMKIAMPMATVADLVNSTAPSLATLQSFGVTESSNMPLPAQSAQSVESFLTNIDKVDSTGARMFTNTTSSLTSLSSAVLSEPVFLRSQRPFLSESQSEPMQIVAKSEAAAIAEQTMAQAANAIASTITTISSMPTNLETTEKLDQLVNSTVESHMGSPTRPEPQKDKNEPSSDVIRDVMLNSRANLMVPPIINTALATPIMSHDSLSPAVILNSQISPSLMCRSTQDSLLQPSVTVESALSPALIQASNPNASPIVTSNEPEKVVLYKAAVDLFETQKKLSELKPEPIMSKIMDDFMTMATTGSGDVLPANTLSQLQGGSFGQADLISKEPVKELTQAEKKNEDRMIPQAFTSLTENELINLINPSCFDQV